MKVDDIFYENGYYWIWKDKDTYKVMVTGSIASITDSEYSHSCTAIARTDYLARTHTENRNEIRYNNLYKAYQNEMQRS